MEILNKKASTRKSKKVEIMVLAVALLLTFVITILPHGRVDASVGVYLSFGINGVIWTFLLFREFKRHPFSIHMIHWCFCLFFFFFAALMQYACNKFPWTGTHDEKTILLANMLLLVWSIAYCLGQMISQKTNRISAQNSKRKVFLQEEWNGYEKAIYLTTFISIAVTIYRIITVGFSNLFSLGTSSQFSYSDNSSLNVLLSKVSMYAVYFSTVFSIYAWQKKRRISFLLINASCLLISFFPTAIARNNVAGIYVGLLLTFFISLKKNRLFIILYLLAFLILFPFLNAFRLVSFSQVNIGDALRDTINNIPDAWLVSDYDAFSMLCTTIEYTRINGFSYGIQFLGVLFFWIPRAIWPTKPGGSGEMIAEGLKWDFTNVSEPLMAESYLNFGLFGIILIAFLCGFLFTKIDSLYWSKAKRNISSIFRFDSLYFFMIGYFLFVFRGALLSAFAYLFAAFVTWFALTRFKNICYAKK